MILNRITQHLRAQNWAAVMLELLIVSVGVLIGIQAANWNDAARDRDKEAIVLDQLAGEFTSAVESAKIAKIKSDESLEATRTVLRVIRDDKEPDNKKAFLQSLRLASSFQSGPTEPVTLTELLSSGGLSELSSPDLRTALVQYHEISTTQADISDLVLERISSPNDGFHDAIHINPDFDPELDNFLAMYEWDLISSTRQQFQVLLYGKLALQTGIDQQVTRGAAVLAAIQKARK